MELAAIAATVLVVIGAALLTLLWPNHKIASVWVFYTIIVLAPLPFFVAWHQKIKTEDQKQATSPSHIPPSLAAGVVLKSAFGRNGTSGFWVAYTGSYGKTLSPTNAAILLRVVNRNDYAIRIETCSAEVFYKGQSHKIFRVPTGPAHVPYFGFAPQDLSAVDISGEDFQENAEKEIPARGSVQGWVLFEFPKEVSESPSHVENEIGELRISVTDDYGASASVETTPGDKQDSLHGAKLRLSPPVNLMGGAYHIKMMHD